ncbi:MAG: YbaN family protein [bacterium]
MKIDIKKYTYITLGYFFVGLGIIGVFLPIMPTTIFLIIAAALFARSSEQLYNRLLAHKRFGKLIRNYREHRGMPLRAKIVSIAMLVAAISYSILFVAQSMWLKIFLAFICLGVTFYILSLTTIHPITEEEN